MRTYLYLIACMLLMQGCIRGPVAPARKLYNQDFKWSINLPEGFNNLTAGQYAKLQQKGTQAIEKTYGQKVENHSKLIFAFRSDQLHYFEANQQPYDAATDGDYAATTKAVGGVLYNTFKQQIPDAKVDSVSGTETIDHLIFQKFTTEIKLSNNKQLNLIMFSRLFGNKELTITMMYADTTRGNALLKAWRNSKFAQ